MQDLRTDLAVSAGLLALVVAVFAQTIHFEYLNHDDAHYITDNPIVRQGLRAESLRAILTRSHLGNWHPLTSLTNLADVELFGLNPAGPHAVNVVLHALNAVLLFWVLRRMTDRAWPSAFAAALFAVHPLHVESVVWISQRKDVLSTVFLMLTLLAYERYARAPKPWRFVPVMLGLALGLLAKGMLVTLPFVMLLLDYWPLKRVGPRDGQSRYSRDNSGGLLIEKFPLLALSAVFSIITYRVQHAAVTPIDDLTFGARVANAIGAYAGYLLHIVWPVGLIAHYPHAGVDYDVAATIVRGVVLTAIGVCALAMLRQKPYVLIGWLWFLGTLVPVIGLVQVGGQAMADRYTYVPSIGIFIAIAWLSADVSRVPLWLRAAVATMLLLVLAALSWRQTGYWRNSETLWRHNLAYAGEAPLPHLMLAHALTEQERFDEAVTEFENALSHSRSDSDRYWARLGIGDLEFRRKNYELALGHVRFALQWNPSGGSALLFEGKSLMELGRHAEALAPLQRAIELEPNWPEAHMSLGIAWATTGNEAKADESFRRALAIEPSNGTAHANLGSLRARQGRLAESRGYFVEALRLLPSSDASRATIEDAIAAIDREGADN